MTAVILAMAASLQTPVFHQAARTHLSLGKDASTPREIEPQALGKIVAMPQVGGLHHRLAVVGQKPFPGCLRAIRRL